MAKDLTGMKFGRLTAIRWTGSNRFKSRMWLCSCDCGNEVTVVGNSLNMGNTISCGCFRKEVTAQLRKTHGHSVDKKLTGEYLAWQGMFKRCNNKKNKYYFNYGGRGISVCERWSGSFQNFLEDMGNKPFPEYSLDRIDVNGNYEPSNCQWADKFQQAENRRKQKSNTSGTVGVSWNSRDKRWISTIRRNNKMHRLGSFINKEDAINARKTAEHKLSQPS